MTGTYSIVDFGFQLIAREIAGILHRREQLLALIGERLAERGEGEVLFSYGDAAGSGVAPTEDVESPAPPPS